MRGRVAPFASRTHIPINSYANGLNRLLLPVDNTEIAAGGAVVTIAVVNSLGATLNATFTNRF